MTFFHISRMGGYNKKEVDEYVEKLNRQITELQEENRSLYQRVLELSTRKDTEKKIHEEQTAQFMIASRKEADNILTNARITAGQIIADAQKQAEEEKNGILKMREKQEMQEKNNSLQIMKTQNNIKQILEEFINQLDSTII